MRIAYFGYDRGLEIEKDHELIYFDANSVKEKGASEVKNKITSFSPDLIIQREYNDGVSLFGEIFSDLPFKKAFWAIDTHLMLKEHLEYSKYFDYVFVSGKRFVQDFKQALPSKKIYHLPLCYPLNTESIVKNRGSIMNQIVFIGNIKSFHQKRREMVEFLAKIYDGKFYHAVDYQNMMGIVKYSKIAFNCSLNGDLNFRVFEVLGAGTEFVTDDIPELDTINGLRERVSTYKNEGELKEKIDGILANDPKYTHNEFLNQEWIREKHCLVHRLSALIDMIQFNSQINF